MNSSARSMRMPSCTPLEKERDEYRQPRNSDAITIRAGNKMSSAKVRKLIGSRPVDCSRQHLLRKGPDQCRDESEK